MTAVKTNLAEVDAYHTPFQPMAAVPASTVQDAFRIVTPMRGTVTLANATSTVISIAGMLATSQFALELQPGASVLASQMLPFVTIASQIAGSITLSHPIPTGTCSYNYTVQI